MENESCTCAFCYIKYACVCVYILFCGAGGESEGVRGGGGGKRLPRYQVFVSQLASDERLAGRSGMLTADNFSLVHKRPLLPSALYGRMMVSFPCPLFFSLSLFTFFSSFSPPPLPFSLSYSPSLSGTSGAFADDLSSFSPLHL